LQTFQDLTNDLSQSAPYQAGFVPPPAPITITQDQYAMSSSTSYQQQAMIPSFLTEDANNSIESYNDTSSMSDSSWNTPPPTVMDEVIVSNSNGKGRPRTSYASSSNNGPQKRKNVGGRKPNKPSNLSPEEEEKRRVRRERNKQAAARCRRRREDHTQILQEQVDEMEEKKRQMTAEIQQMNQMRDELLELIEEHRKNNECVKPDRGSSPPDVKPNLALNGRIPITTSVANVMPMTIQRPANFTTALNNNNNNNNNNNSALNANSKLTLKIKAEPAEIYDDEPPSKRRCEM
jgi:fos-like antigen